MIQILKNKVKRRNLLQRITQINYAILKGQYPILLNYPVNPTPRYGYGKPPHPELYEIINKNRPFYEKELEKFLSFTDFFRSIPLKRDKNLCPFWLNNWLPGLDAVALYSFLSLNNPSRYFEIGSGNSTLFARKAIIDHDLRTEITVIDPYAKAQMASICDRFIPYPLENIDVHIFDEMRAGDILFIDSTHRVFMNSDVTVIFLEILPRLSKGVLIEFHDILLPYDYPFKWRELYFSEQYLLGAILLARGNLFDIILPNYFISKDHELNEVAAPIWDGTLSIVKRYNWSHGWSFWVRKY